jgi:hypothetical protein
VADVEVRPGETSTVTFSGYVVTVRVRWPADLAPGKNLRVDVGMETSAQPPLLRPPAEIAKDPQALAQWLASPEVRALAKVSRPYGFVEGADGVWTAEGVRAGADYVLRAAAGDRAATNGSPPIAYGETSVTLPAEPASGTIDAGEVVLQGIKAVPVRVWVGPR